MTPLLTQDTPEWLAYKQRRIGGTAAPVIWLGSTEWTTEYELWEQLTGRGEVEFNLGMARGKELEGQARRLYGLETGIEAQPAVVVAPEAPWAIASLDGRALVPITTRRGAAKEDRLVEIKCPNRELHEATAQTRVVPEPYRIQIQHYLWVTAADATDYVSYHPDCKPALVIIRVERDETLITALADKERAWYERHIVNDEPPARGPRDVIMRDDKEWKEAAQIYREAEAAHAEWERKKEAARALLLSLMDGALKVAGGGVQVTRYTQIGNLNWSELVRQAKAAGVNVEALRGPPQERTKITVSR